MELEKYKTKSHDYTAKASEIARQLNLAGIGIIWIIKTAFPEIKLVDFQLLVPLVFISISLLSDFLQNLIGGIIWMDFYKKKEKEGFSGNTDVKSLEWRSRVLYGFYFVKFVCMFLAYIFIITTLFKYF